MYAPISQMGKQRLSHTPPDGQAPRLLWGPVDRAQSLRSASSDPALNPSGATQADHHSVPRFSHLPGERGNPGSAGRGGYEMRWWHMHTHPPLLSLPDSLASWPFSLSCSSLAWPLCFLSSLRLYDLWHFMQMSMKHSALRTAEIKGGDGLAWSLIPHGWQ